MKRKLLTRMMAGLLCAMLLFNLLPHNAFATEMDIESNTEMQLAASSGTGMPGDVIQVVVEVRNNPGLASLKFYVGFDSNLILMNVEFGSEFGAMVTTPEPYSNPQPITMISPLSDITADGVFATLTFKIAESAPDGYDADVNITFDPDDIFNGVGDPVQMKVTDGTIRIVHGIPGDIDGDRKVNTKDAILLFRYVAGWDVEVQDNAVDVNGDGTVNTKDAILLFRYVAGWDVEIGRHNHTLTLVEAKAETCTEDGNVAYWYCAECKKYFKDAEAVSEIAYPDTVIVAKGHTEEIDPAVQATCVQTGLTEGKHCSVCNDVIVPQFKTNKVDHTPGADATCTEDQTCTVCHEVIATANGHIPGVEATCTEPQRCTVCKIALSEALGHSLKYVQERDPVDENDPGNCAYWQCSACNKCYLDENAVQEIALADTAWKTYLVYFYDIENGTYTVGAYRQDKALYLNNITPADLKGYDFNGWHTDDNFTDQNKKSVIPVGNSENVNLYANRSLHEYRITLLGLGREETWTYNVLDGKKFTTPTWQRTETGGDCMIFSHWEDEAGNEISQIPVGEIGDRTITANWIYKKNHAISNKNKYTYITGTVDESGRYSFVFEIGTIENIVLRVQDEHKFDGLTQHSVADEKGYTVGTSEGREAASTISKIVSSSTAMGNISSYTETHSEGWNVGAKWKPEIEVEGIKASAWEVSGGYSENDTTVFEDAGFSNETNYTEGGEENEIRSYIDYYTQESASRTITEVLIPGVTPVGKYIWARMMDVKVYAIVTYNPYTGYYVLDIYSVPILVHDGMLYELPNELADEVNIVSGDVLDFEIPFDKLPDMLYTVEYNANNGSGESMKSVHELGRTSQLLTNTFTKTGYTFVGWSTAADGKTAIYADQASIRDIAAAGETVTLYAIWVENSYTVQYNGNKPTHASSTLLDIPGATECKYDSTVTLGNAPKLAGYTFGGWYLDPSCNVKVGDAGMVKENANLTAECDGTVTLYAKWTANSYTITYDAGGGTLSCGSEVKRFDSQYGELPEPKKKNYHFLGWEDENGNTVKDETYITTSKDHKLTAKWLKVSHEWYVERNTYLDEGVSHEDFINPAFDKDALVRAGRTKITVRVTFDAQVAKSCYQRIIAYSRDTGKEFYGKDWDIAEGSWQEDLYFEFTIELSQLQADGGFWIRWHCVDSNWGDAWRLGTTTVTVTATEP